MSNFLISTMPESGHVNPMLPIAAALAARGHRVRWHTGAEYRETVEATGARFTPMRHAPRFQDLPPRRDPGDGWDAVSAVLERLYLEPAAGQLRDYQDIVAEFPADVVFSESTSALGGYLLHELGGPPWARLGVSMPPTLPNSAVPPLFSPGLFADTPEAPKYSSSPAAMARNRELNHEVAHFHLRAFTNALSALRVRLGLPPLPDGATALDATISPFLQVQTGTPAFDYPRDELPPQVRHVGPLLPPVPDMFDPPSWWAEATSGDRPVVHVTQGTVATDPGRLLAPTLAALADDDVLVVATTPAPDALGTVPANARIARTIPYPSLLPNVDAMVTNGGIGGVLFALAHGVPLVATGQSEDKPAICARIAHTGVGIDLRSAAAPEPARIRDAVRSVLTDPAFRRNAERVRADFARHDPPAEAADLLERLAATGRPVIG
ncbi:glycosyltransferase [Actinomadura algeriensis]|uniref:MGT family glycosyltransferase n=1 Tax=Actinomadura algeriensis TaxID=1679523 RepID=A0ABR9JJD7_9ACTN|nr:nucleotide disphospho-sugar-binding domain-containing protein [Actinomadura algeriensis]MBE1530506.1 MGT family glycosyltransferase [Actinomadura algeriensis]